MPHYSHGSTLRNVKLKRFLLNFQLNVLPVKTVILTQNLNVLHQKHAVSVKISVLFNIPDEFMGTLFGGKI